MKKVMNFGVIILAISQLVSSYIFANNANLTQGSFSGLPLSPKPYAFIIWGLIIMLSIASTINFTYKNKLNNKIMALTSIIFLSYTLWLLAAMMDYLFISIFIFTIMNIALFFLNKDKTIIKDRLGNIAYKIYYGWASIAIFLNIHALINKYYTDSIYFSIGILLFIIITIIKINISLKYSPYYNLAVLWALLAILLNLYLTVGILFFLVLVAFIIVLMLLGYGLKKKIKTIFINLCIAK